jgi:hypothetical protein
VTVPDDLLGDDVCPGCGRSLPRWREFPYHLPDELHAADLPYLNDAIVLACVWDRRSLMARYDRRHGVPS